MKLEKQFFEVVSSCHFFDRHSRVLVAVSGGVDSMNLLQLLIRFRKKLQIDLGIAHVNHHQRPESEEEEMYLRKLADLLAVPIYVGHFEGGFSEKNARDFRYQFFSEVMKKEDYTALVTAHHADDQAETIFMRFVRGTRLSHLAGIQPVRSFADGELIRPLLTFRKADLTDVFHFEDKSNQEEQYFRNRVRHHYLPHLSKENPSFVNALIELGKESKDAYQALRDLTKKMDVTDLSLFQSQTDAIQRFLLQEYLVQFPDLELTRRQFELTLHILRKKTNYCHELKNGYELVKDYTRFSISKKINPETDDIRQDYVLQSGEKIIHQDKLEISLDVPLENPTQVLFVKKNKVVSLRYRRTGDRVLINGISKKLRRYFIDEKIPKRDRDNCLIVEQDNQIYGIVSMMSSDLSKSLKDDIMRATLYIKMKE